MMNHRMRTWSSLLMWLLAVAMWAGPVSLEQARKTAMQVMGLSAQNEVRLLSVPTRGTGATPAYYIFDNNEGPGFAIISGEDRLPAVVGYATTGKVAGTGNREMPEGLQWLLGAYAQYVEAIQAGVAELPEESYVTRATAEPIQPLMASTWTQSTPFNNLCPEGTVVGCVATAMSQIMYYHQWPIQGTGIVSTSYNGLWLTSDLSTHSYGWADMRNSPIEYQSDEVASQEVAQLCYDCGLAVKMQYGPASGSREGYVLNALYNNFGYMGSGMELLRRDCYTKDEWLDMIGNDLQAGCPVYYGGATEDGAGHAFVLDGRDAQGYVHVNWGWGGYLDGYFDIALLNPDASNAFTNNQSMIKGIRPARDGQQGELASAHLCVLDNLSVDTPQTSYGKSGSGDFKVIAPSIWNDFDCTYNGYATIALYDANGALLQQDIKKDRFFTFAFDLSIGYFTYAGQSINCKLPAGLSDGEYVLKLVTREKDKKDWTCPFVGTQWQHNYIRAVVKGSRVSFDSQATTGIDAIQATSTDESIYSLDGMRLNRAPKGIYVKGGKKYVSTGR